MSIYTQMDRQVGQVDWKIDRCKYRYINKLIDRQKDGQRQIDSIARIYIPFSSDLDKQKVRDANFAAIHWGRGQELKKRPLITIQEG